jgi:hypothetical protein
MPNTKHTPATLATTAKASKAPIGDDTTTGGGSSTYTTICYLPGFSDTHINQGISALAGKSTDILTQVSLLEMGNAQRQARKGKERVIYDQFGRESTQEAIKENLSNSEKAPQHALSNVLGLGSIPKPRGPG